MKKIPLNTKVDFFFVIAHLCRRHLHQGPEDGPCVQVWYAGVQTDHPLHRAGEGTYKTSRIPAEGGGKTWQNHPPIGTGPGGIPGQLVCFADKSARHTKR